MYEHLRFIYKLLFVAWVFGCIVFFANSFAATAGTNTRDATFKIIHSGLLH